MPDVREEFEVRYPLPEGMVRNGEAYQGHHLWWVWTDKWETWQASRAALKVELPEKIGPHNMIGRHVLPEAAGYDDAIDDCREALQQAGIEVKHG